MVLLLNQGTPYKMNEKKGGKEGKSNIKEKKKGVLNIVRSPSHKLNSGLRTGHYPRYSLFLSFFFNYINKSGMALFCYY
jgi:hypothetical protein